MTLGAYFSHPILLPGLIYLTKPMMMVLQSLQNALGNIITFDPPTMKSHEAVVIVTFILQVRKLRFRVTQ